MPMTDSEWLHYRDLKSRCPACKRPAHIAKRDETFYFVDDEYNPFVRHAPVKTTEAVFRFFANAGADEIIGYNVGFDLGFLSAVGVRPREDARITDTMNLFTWFMGRRYKLVDAADHIGYEWTGRAHGSLADALATLAVQRWLEQWLVAE